jgi:hypothetical protein
MIGYDMDEVELDNNAKLESSPEEGGKTALRKYLVLRDMVDLDCEVLR